MSIQILNRYNKKSNFLKIENINQKKGSITIKVNLFICFDKNTKLRATNI